MPFKYPKSFDELYKKTMPEEIYATIEDPESEDRYLQTHTSQIDAAEEGTPDDGIWVATYKLVKIEPMYVERSAVTKVCL